MPGPGDRSIGVDVGGTFTDFFSFGPDGISAWKRLSTPAAPEVSVIAGLDSALDAGRIVHGSTVATNALLERLGPRTVLVTTAGFKDLLEIRRQERPRLYDLEPQRRPHVVARGDVVEVAARMDADGRDVTPLSDAEVARVVSEVVRIGPESVAVCLLFSYRDPGHEVRIAKALREAGFDVSASHEVMPEHREYERASTTAVNAFLRPPVRGYLSRLSAAAPRLRVMDSPAGVTTPAAAGERPVSMVMSGPAGGVLGALAVAAAAGYPDIITVDMGGTSTDVALCDGAARFRTATEIDGLALHTPVVDVVTVGAGGGSIARLDAGGALVVGPESAGADPGPACYGRGELPTVSDANLVLGRLRAGHFLGGEMRLDPGRAAQALASLGEPGAAAQATLDVVNANMARALRAVSLERGFDPARFTLVAFGGAGPLHACDLAAILGMPRVLIPRYPGVLSALGMVTAPDAVERSRSALMVMDDSSEGAVTKLAGTLLRDAAAASDEAGVDAGRAAPVWSADARYQGQAHELRVTFDTPRPSVIAEAFGTAHERQYGYRLDGRTVELVNLRVRLEAPPPPSPLVRHVSGASGAAVEPEEIEIGGLGAAKRYDREALRPGDWLDGPAVVTQLDATTVIAGGWGARVDTYLNLVMERSGG